MAPSTSTATAPSQRARDEVNQTYLSSSPTDGNVADCSCRWAYLEKNVDNVMNKLQEGLDMKTYM
jgi:hypothetical protein